VIQSVLEEAEDRVQQDWWQEREIADWAGRIFRGITWGSGGGDRIAILPIL